MSIPLEHLTPCFQGLIPSTLFTCSADGVPNVAYLSHVEYVDSTHVALSFQFFNKSRRNVGENPYALVRVLDPDTKRGYDLHLRFSHSEKGGALFETMRLRIEAIASFCGLKGTFRLLAADVYEVLAVEEVPEEPGDDRSAEQEEEEPAVLFSMNALQSLAEAVQGAECLDTLLDSVLEQLERLFRFRHSMILLDAEQEGRLVALATRGYGNRGVGAEVGYGEGIIGMAAEARAPIRISGLLRQMLYAAAVQQENEKLGLSPLSRRVPLPGLENAQSLLAVPLLAGGDLLGVVFSESEEPYRFHEEDKACVMVLGSFVAAGIQNALLRARLHESGTSSAGCSESPLQRESNERPPAKTRRHSTIGDGNGNHVGGGKRILTYFRSEDCILLDGEYLVRSLPARILWRLLEVRAAEQRAEFTNRELRLDKSLALPAYKDNLETRLLLLRRRLAQRCPDIRLVPLARGRFALESDSEIQLIERE